MDETFKIIFLLKIKTFSAYRYAAVSRTAAFISVYLFLDFLVFIFFLLLFFSLLLVFFIVVVIGQIGLGVQGSKGMMREVL